MAAITWRNVGASNTGAAAFLRNASEQFNRANQSIQDISQQFVNAGEVRQDRLNTQEKNATLADIASLNKEGFDQGRDDLLKRIEGANYDVSNIYDALARREQFLGEKGTRKLTDVGLGQQNEEGEIKLKGMSDRVKTNDNIQKGILNKSTFDDKHREAVYNTKVKQDAAELLATKAKTKGLTNINNSFKKDKLLERAIQRARATATKAQAGAYNSSAGASKALASLRNAQASNAKANGSAAKGNNYSAVIAHMERKNTDGTELTQRQLVKAIESSKDSDRNKTAQIKILNEHYKTNEQEASIQAGLDRRNNVSNSSNKAAAAAQKNSDKLLAKLRKGLPTAKQMNYDSEDTVSYNSFLSGLPRYVMINGQKVVPTEEQYNKSVYKILDETENNLWGSLDLPTDMADLVRKDLIARIQESQAPTPSNRSLSRR